ncbi:MAG: type II toxin-antitoxin system RelE family toxin [Chloroflexota bacterium]
MSPPPAWQISWTPAAIDDLADLDDTAGLRIRAAVQRLAETREGDVKKLKGMGDRWRLRIGDWRVLFRFARDPQTLIVLRVVNRREAYRD